MQRNNSELVREQPSIMNQLENYLLPHRRRHITRHDDVDDSTAAPAVGDNNVDAELRALYGAQKSIVAAIWQARTTAGFSHVLLAIGGLF
jgi:hypothetical protein